MTEHQSGFLLVKALKVGMLIYQVIHLLFKPLVLNINPRKMQIMLTQNQLPNHGAKNRNDRMPCLSHFFCPEDTQSNNTTVSLPAVVCELKMQHIKDKEWHYSPLKLLDYFLLKAQRQISLISNNNKIEAHFQCSKKHIIVQIYGIKVCTSTAGAKKHCFVYLMSATPLLFFLLPS